MNAFIFVAGQVAILCLVFAGLTRMVGATKWSGRLFWAGIGVAVAAPFAVAMACSLVQAIEGYSFLVYPAAGGILVAILVAAKLRLDARLGAVAKAFPPPKTSMKERLAGEE